jgi:hypothetical protein
MHLTAPLHPTPCWSRSFGTGGRDASEQVGAIAGMRSGQMQAITEQAKDLSETATKLVMDSLKTPTKGGLSS